MGIVITATNIRGTVATYWVPVSKIPKAYASFDAQWSVARSRIYSSRPKGVQYHINERI